MRRSVIAALGLAVAMAACGADDPSAEPLVVGANDVTKACEARSEWTQATSGACLDCLALAQVERCDCTAGKDFAGKCSVQQRAVEREQACSGVSECVFRCAQGDCGCVEACYSGRDACRARASERDGCLAEICAAHCR